LADVRACSGAVKNTAGELINTLTWLYEGIGRKTRIVGKRSYPTKVRTPLAVLPSFLIQGGDAGLWEIGKNTGYIVGAAVEPSKGALQGGDKKRGSMVKRRRERNPSKQ